MYAGPQGPVQVGAAYGGSLTSGRRGGPGGPALGGWAPGTSHSSVCWWLLSEGCWGWSCLPGEGSGGQEGRCGEQGQGDTALSAGREFPSSFESLVKKICRYLFHVLAHIYSSHFKETLALELHGHLNTLYIHFILFAREFNLLDPKETAVMDDLTEVLCSGGGHGGGSTDGASGGGAGGTEPCEGEVSRTARQACTCAETVARVPACARLCAHMCWARLAGSWRGDTAQARPRRVWTPERRLPASRAVFLLDGQGPLFEKHLGLPPPLSTPRALCFLRASCHCLICARPHLPALPL